MAKDTGRPNTVWSREEVAPRTETVSTIRPFINTPRLSGCVSKTWVRSRLVRVVQSKSSPKLMAQNTSTSLSGGRTFCFATYRANWGAVILNHRIWGTISTTTSCHWRSMAASHCRSACSRCRWSSSAAWACLRPKASSSFFTTNSFARRLLAILSLLSSMSAFNIARSRSSWAQPQPTTRLHSTSSWMSMLSCIQSLKTAAAGSCRKASSSTQGKASSKMR
mmetsp:Transcript_45891/g.103988  ORF Transcript_45891/g.103988 Transcript_45891/m.103988 type:complete len:222 (-) Transcript_45891:473-1138(-)